MAKVSRLLIHGASGRMGQALVGIRHDVADVQCVAAVAGRSAPEIAGVEGFDAARLDQVPPFDVCIDFSLPEAFDAVLGLCVERGAALVSGTTGLNAVQQLALDTAARRIPVLWSANFSLGVAVLAHVAAQASRLLPDWDCEIFEAHHRNKQDAPSGTALMLGERVRESRGANESLLSLDRNGLRPSQGIGFSVMRAGDIIGEHEVHLVGAGERIELVHRAMDRRLFARGALVAARWLCGRQPGRYTLEAVLGL